MIEDRFRVRGWSIYDSGYYDDVQDMLFGEEDNMTLLDAIFKGLVSEPLTLVIGFHNGAFMEIIGNIHENLELMEGK